MGSVIPGLWSGISGRDFRPQAVNAGILIFILSFVLRYKLHWKISHMLISLIPTQLIILLCISYFSGFTGLELFHWFNLHWLLSIDLFICVPWGLGIIVGIIVKKKCCKVT